MGASSARWWRSSSPAPARAAAERTIFAVGDEKQSIFSFQGAAPREFAAMRSHFERAHLSGQARLATLTEFTHSFRSGETVLGAVDTVFARAERPCRL